MSMHQISLLLLFLILPQAVAFGGRVLIKLGGVGVCLTSGLTFFAVSLFALLHLLANPPVSAADPHCGQWLAGFPPAIVVGSLAHTMFTGGVLAILFTVETLRWWWVHGSAYLAEKSGDSPERGEMMGARAGVADGPARRGHTRTHTDTHGHTRTHTDQHGLPRDEAEETGETDCTTQ